MHVCSSWQCDRDGVGSRICQQGLISLSITLLLALVLTGCSGNSTPTVSSVATASARNGTGSNPTAIASPSPGVKLGTQPCPEAVKDPSYWDAIVVTQTNVNKVERVSCASLMGNASLQALVTVRYNGTGALLDVYVYNDITDPSPAQIFKLQSLYKGEAKISGYNTLLTAEVDQNSSINKNVTSNAALTRDLFREFQWSASAGTLVPVAFPGIFPDLTRYQAETAQSEVNQGQQPWRLSATETAQALAAKLLNWNSNAPASITGGGNYGLSAVVTVKNPNSGGGTITVTMSRLEGNRNNGVWEATFVTSPGLSIATPQELDRLSSPTIVAGTGNAFEGTVGQVVILDHLYSDIGHAEAKGTAGNGNTRFSTNVSYSSTFKTGIQEGMLVLYSSSNAGGSGAVMIKEMLS